jgi:hypothetical protein
MLIKKEIKLQGGLGNQLFQYAYGRSLELSGKKIILDNSFYNGSKSKTDTARDFKLNNFSIETKAKFLNRKYFTLELFKKILAKLNLAKDGFYQSEKYFKNIESNIRKEFTLKNPLSQESKIWQEKINNTNNSISLHIRRGDYVEDKKTNAFHGSCDLEYYKKGLGEIKKLIKNENIEIFIFSDDPNWAKENLNFTYPTFFVSDEQIPDYEEMYLMSLCKNNIIANSTFSWWGAWLNRNPNRIVVGPKQWFTNKTSDELEILPKEWVQI